MLGDRIIWANDRHLGHDVRLIPAQYVKPSLSVKDSSSQDGFLCAVWIAGRNLRHDLAEVALLS